MQETVQKVTVDGVDLHYILQQWPSVWERSDLCGFLIQFHQSCNDLVKVTLYYAEYEPCKAYPTQYQKGETQTVEWQELADQPCGTKIVHNVCKGGWYPIPNPTADDDIDP